MKKRRKIYKKWQGKLWQNPKEFPQGIDGSRSKIKRNLKKNMGEELILLHFNPNMIILDTRTPRFSSIFKTSRKLGRRKEKYKFLASIIREK